MKSILVHINRDEGQEARLQTSLDLVRAFGGHLTCLQASPLDAFLAADPYGIAFSLERTLREVRSQDEAEREAVEARLKTEGISWDWQVHTGSPAGRLADAGGLADLIVASAPGGPAGGRLDIVSAADVVMAASTPVLSVPGNLRGIDCCGVAVVAWNGSPESCQAIRAAVPMLAMASSVVLVTAQEGEGPDLSASEAGAYLSRHGVKAELLQLKAGSHSAAQIILGEAAVRKASYVVMGAYGHSRLRERLLGGVTRDMLEQAGLPLLMMR